MQTSSREHSSVAAALKAALPALWACAVLLMPSVSLGQVGSLDADFGDGGLVTTDFGGDTDFAFSVAVQADEKIVAAGFAVRSSTGLEDFALVRYNSDGSLDAGFGDDGLVATPFDEGADVARSVAVQSDGNIVAAGYSSDPNGDQADFALARYLPDGSLDAGFGDGGLVTTDFGDDRDEAFSVTVQADGKIVAAGWTMDPGSGTRDFALARYNPDGSLDAGFGTGGLVTTDFDGGRDEAFSIAMQADGKIVAAGHAADPSGDQVDFALARYDPDGSLDAGFGTGGLVTTDFDGDDDFAWSTAVQADGTIVAAGWAFDPTGGTRDFALARYNPDGSLDDGFGTGGLVTTDFDGASDVARSVAVQADEKIVAAGSSDDGNGLHFALTRYLPDGSLDEGFGDDGFVVTDFAGDDDDVYSLALQADGKIVAAGSTLDPGTGMHDFALTRYLDAVDVSREAMADLPATFDLAQNYPNPFNPSTEIRFALPTAEHVRLAVYDLTGREVARLVDRPLQAGTHHVPWRAEDVPSGPYMYRLTAGSFTAAKMMVLVK